jgi:uncharacterized membrane protein
VTGLPDRTPLHRVLGWHAPRLRRVVVVATVGAVAFAVALPMLGWELAALIAWDVAAVLFLGATWHLILGADAAQTRHLATVEDESRQTAALLTVAACVASLVAVAFTVAAADRREGAAAAASVTAAGLTIVVSWLVLNTLYTLRYADAHYGAGAAIGFGTIADPDYRDFAYLAFTIGMCYQVSDQQLRTHHMRRTVLGHALLAYLFGVVIVAATINLVAGLVDA